MCVRNSLTQPWELCWELPSPLYTTALISHRQFLYRHLYRGVAPSYFSHPYSGGGAVHPPLPCTSMHLCRGGALHPLLIWIIQGGVFPAHSTLPHSSLIGNFSIGSYIGVLYPDISSHLYQGGGVVHPPLLCISINLQFCSGGALHPLLIWIIQGGVFHLPLLTP